MSDLAEAAKDVQTAKKQIEGRTLSALAGSMDDVRKSLMGALVSNGSVTPAPDTLADTLQTTPTPPVQSKALGGVGITGASYWKYLEYGTGIYSSPKRPFKAASPGPPPSKILAWIQSKGITPRPDGPADTQEELAYAITNSLSKGTRSHPFVRPVWRSPRGKDHVMNSVEDAMEDAIDRSF